MCGRQDAKKEILDGILYLFPGGNQFQNHEEAW